MPPEDSPPTRAIGRNNSIGFLRLLLAALVIVSHSYFLSGSGPDPLGAWTGGTMFLGKLGVQAFFVLSGYLVATSFQHSPSVSRYLWHRFLRLAPALWACLLFTALVIAPLLYISGPAETGFWAQEPGPLGYFARNFFNPRAQAHIGELLAKNPHPFDLNGSLWTLFYEAACYVLVIFVGMTGGLTRFRRLGLALLLGFIGLYLLWRLQPGWLPAQASRLFDTDGKVLCVHFAAGMTLTVLTKAALQWLSSPWVTGLAGLALLASYQWNFHPLATPLVLAPLILGLAIHLPVRNLEDRLGGDYSYGLYVYGYPVQQTLVYFGAHQAGLFLFGLASLGVSFGLAVLSWRLVEAPALRLKSLGAGR